MIPGDLLSVFSHRQFHTLLGLLDSRAALPNSCPNACMPMQGGSLRHFYDGLWYDSAERRTHYLTCERRTHYRLSQPDTVMDGKYASWRAQSIAWDLKESDRESKSNMTDYLMDHMRSSILSLCEGNCRANETKFVCNSPSSVSEKLVGFREINRLISKVSYHLTLVKWDTRLILIFHSDKFNSN